jgi:hypothetical protein
MATSSILAQPVPTRSPETANVDLRHPLPDLQSLQGAYVGNIERLEEHAERMSEHGSDLGEEIRRLHTELKRSDSRRSSLRSAAPLEEPTRQFSTRSRNLSTSSHSHSIVDLNGAARWGGYSPAGYVTSPVGSMRSNSWSNPSIQRQRSESKTSRLGQVVHPDEVEDGFAAYPTSPQSLRTGPLAVHNPESPPETARKVSSFTRKYDEIANELRDELQKSVNFDEPAPQEGQPRSGEYNYQYTSHHDPPDRPPTAASTDTTRQARTLWQDFDGVHCPNTVPEEEPSPPPSNHTHSRHSSHHSMLKSTYELPLQGVPPPDDAMVFYPAPVPRMLNLPKRLSQLPAVDIQARRRTQLLDSMQGQNRLSMPLLGETAGEPSRPNRKSRQSIAGLPPQLRASAYFDQVGPSQEFAVKGESAEDTLDSILDASAHAPVSAFTDHPFAGHVGNEVYGPEHKRKSSKLPQMPTKPEEARRRSSFIMLDTKRNSSGDMLNKLKKRNSSVDMTILVAQARENRMSLADELDEHDEHARGPQTDHDTMPIQRSYDGDGRNPDDVYNDEHLEDSHLEAEEVEAEEIDEPRYFGAPTTLLAELQMRKEKQKTRKMNYATLVEQGNMPTHRTLMQLDEIAEKEKQRRLKKKVNLAWEAQAEDDSDDDVPLGVLYNKANQQSKNDWNQPTGLIARRELEEQEPLSRRAARLRGESPSKRGLSPSASQAYLTVPTTTTPGPESDEDEGETLAERMRRIREKKELTEALGNDVRKSTISTDFASEMLAKIGVADATKENEAPQPTPSPGVDEEETLGQRRARLQAEAAARGDGRPRLCPSLSMADVLNANPLDANQARKISERELVSHLPAGSLLHQNVVAEERRKAQMLNQNMRASSYGSQPYKQAPNMPTFPGQQQPGGMMYNPQMMGAPPQSMMGMPMMNMGMMGMPMPVNGMGARQSYMPMGMGMPMMNMNMNGGMGMGMMMPPMDPRSRDNIDRWMSGIQHQ